MGFSGAVIRFGGIGLRILLFLCCAIILGIQSYFLSVLADNNVPIAARWKGVEGIAGAGTIYTICGIVLTVCLGGVRFFGFLAVVLDILFAGAFIAVAWFLRHSAGSCTGIVNTPIGTGQSDAGSIGDGVDNATISGSLYTACRLGTAEFAVSIIAVFLFIVAAAWNVLMVRHHQKEKKFGPGPNNNYTSGSGRRPFWKRNHRTKHVNKDAEAATALGGTRYSGETATTMGHPAATAEPKFGQPGYGETGNYHQTANHHHTRPAAGNF